MTAQTAIILCAGLGTRIRSVTDRPKCLLDVAGASILCHQLASLESVGVMQVVVVAGYRVDLVREALGAIDYAGSVIVVENADPLRLGNSHSLLLGLLEATTDVVILDGDLMFDSGILACFMGCFDDAFAVGPGAQDDVECAKAICDRDGFLLALIDKRPIAPAELEGASFAGEAMGIIHVSDETRRKLIETATTFLNTPGNEGKNWEHLFNAFIPSHPMRVHFLDTDRWVEIDDESDLERAQALFSY